jgi:hypoxanthine phosphoribosyltransferase
MKELRRIVTWEEVDEQVAYLAAKLTKHSPDVIVGIARGGLIPAVMLSHLFNVPLVVINLSYRDKKAGHSNLTDQLLELNKYKKAVVVDDICDSGKTFEELKKYFNVMLTNNVRFVSLFAKKTAEFKPDVVADVINKKDDHKWIVFPWE